MNKNIKKVSHWLFENGFPALFWSGLTVSVNLMLFEEFFVENSCDKTHSYGKDAGKILFWCVFFIRFAAVPTASHFLRKHYDRHLPSEETIERFEVETNDSIETGTFVFETMESLELPGWLAPFLVVPAIWPLSCSIFKLFRPNFSRGPEVAYRNLTPLKLKYSFIVMEGLYNLLSLASAASFITDLLFNVLYNSTHPEPYENEKAILVSCICLAAIVGGFSILGKKMFFIMRYSEASINTLYYSLNIGISSASCLDPAAFTDSGFMKTGWKYTLAFGIFSLFLAGIGGKHGVSNSYLPHHQGHAGSKGTMFPFITDSDSENDFSRDPGLALELAQPRHPVFFRTVPRY